MASTELEPLVPRVEVAGRPEGYAWTLQPLFWTERMRGKALFWPIGAPWLLHDPLGHVAHSHPGASEVYAVVAGTLEVTVGRTEFELGAGEFCFIPESGFHDPRGNAGTDMCLFCVVAPNFRGARWKTRDFTEEELSVVPQRARLDAPGPLPGDASLESAVVRLAPGEVETVAPRPHAERVVYVLEGEAELEVDRLSGRLEAHAYQAIPSGAHHRIRSAGDAPLRYLSVWAIDATATDPKAEDAAAAPR